MSDDSFFREVNEDVRAERMRTFWSRYGWIVISAVVLIIALTAGWRGYEYWQSRQASQSGDAFLAALNLANNGETEEALAALETLQEEGYGAYPVLARMRAATLRAEAGDPETAVATFTAIGEDGAVPLAIREAARLRAAYLLVDHGSYDEVLATVKEMTAEDHPMRHSAREALGLSAWAAGELETAEQWFSEIAADEGALQGPAERAEIMLDLIAAADPGGAAPAVEVAPEAEAAPVPEAPLSLETIAPELAPTAPEAPEVPEAEPGMEPAAEGAANPAAPGLAPLEPLQEQDPS